MNKNQGATIGAILLAGLFLRPGGVTPPKDGGTSNGEGTATAAASKAAEGPWIASCRYWAARRGNDPTADTKPTHIEPQPLNGHESWLKQSNGEIEVHVHATAQSEKSFCPADEGKRWGIPDEKSQISIETIIATVPDPVHTHLALSFDRTIDALLQAAADNAYVSSYYWLPWKLRTAGARGVEESGDLEPGHDPERERMPGLIILKEATRDEGWNRTIYLFLVAESPTVGVDGDELSNAFHQEREIRKEFLTSGTFMRGRDEHIGIIGPMFTGAAQSLREGIEHEVQEMKKDPRLKNPESGKLNPKPADPLPPAFDIAAQTSSYLATATLGGEMAGAKVDFVSFTDNFSFDRKSFLERLRASGYDSEAVTFLVEDNTALGSFTAGVKLNPSLTSSSPSVESIADMLEKHPELIPKMKEILFQLPHLTVLKSVADISDARLYNDIASNPGLRLRISASDFFSKYRGGKGGSADSESGNYTTIRFPREISLLRNAQATAETGGNVAAGSSSTPSPYLHLSLKDSSAVDAVPHFARDLTPLSQESQLMGIARQLRRANSKFVVIVASNVLDGIFLSQFIHRSCPDVRQVFFGADGLMVREVDNVPFIGSLTFGAYTLGPFFTGYTPRSPNVVRDYSDSQSEATYNSASWILWRKNIKQIQLKGYRQPHAPEQRFSQQPSLWAMTIGADGYYPLSILNACASNFLTFLPEMNRDTGTLKPQYCSTTHIDDYHWDTYPLYPSLFWKALCSLISLLCFTHALVLFFSNYWSPLTRDVALENNDHPNRRATYLHVSAASLFCMAFIIAYPTFALGRLITVGSAHKWELAAISCATLAVIATFWKTRKFLKWTTVSFNPEQALIKSLYRVSSANVFFLVNFLTWLAMIAVIALWIYIGTGRWAGGVFQYVGIAFNFRNMYPGSGVSPMIPILLLLAGWYIWAVCQTQRLRFSEANRPHLPGRIDAVTDNRFFVSFEDLGQCQSKHDSCLYQNINCPFITRQLLTRQWKRSKVYIDAGLILVYAIALVGMSLFTPLKSLEHFLGNSRWLGTPYEWLAGGLFFTLISSALAGWLRILVIWNSLRRGLLDKLEHQPIRFGFSRFKGIGWMTLLRQGGIEQQWHDIARSLESMRQILHEETLVGKVSAEQWLLLQSSYKALTTNTADLRKRIQGHKESNPLPDFKLPEKVEETCAIFSKHLLEYVLIPYWEHERVGLVESPESEELPIKAQKSENRESQFRVPLELHASPASADPVHIQVAEEFLVIRYISLIRAVLANVRYLMTFVSAFFVLALVAWNSYPFQPRQHFDWAFTALLICLGSGIVWVFAQMYRNPLLSRITETKPNELGLEFYIRILSFGAVPVFTWLAYQFPDIGGLVFKLLQPGLDVMK